MILKISTDTLSGVVQFLKKRFYIRLTENLDSVASCPRIYRALVNRSLKAGLF